MSEEVLLLSLPLLLSKKKNDKLRPFQAGSKMQRILLRTTVASGAAVNIIVKRTFEGAIMIRQISVSCNEEENAGGGFWYYSYNLSRARYHTLRSFWAKGRHAQDDRILLVPAGEAFSLGMWGLTKAAETFITEVLYEVLK